MTSYGVVPIEVKPITVPQPNGEVKLGAGAADLTPTGCWKRTATAAIGRAR